MSGNTWQVLKRMNPAQVILLYELGPGEYNTADWGRLGPGWEWIRREHGPGTADRWTAVGAKFGECLQGVDYANERLMLVGNPNWQQFYTEDQWLQQVQIFRNLRHVRAAMNVHGPVQERANDLERMDSADAAGRRAWDVFWFALASFLLGYDDQRPNGYLNCTVWGYARFYWLREFDPQCLHLGRAQDEFRRVEGRTGHVYLREFQDGWVVVNPTSTTAADVAVPRGRARLIDHDALEQPESRPLVEQFNLAAQRAIVLLKEGRALGNADNKP
jgi:hypothetical protein